MERYLVESKMADIKLFEELLKLCGSNDELEVKLITKKQELRSYLRGDGKYNPSFSGSWQDRCLQSKTIIASDCDGYVEKCVFKPSFDGYTKEEIEHTFETWFTLEINSPYDCTGLSFTAWYRVAKINNHWTVYHRVGIDC